MESFKNFELNNTEMIFGGDLQNTKYENRDGSGGNDIYDSDNDRIIYPDPE